MKESNRSLLLVDDEPSILKALKRTFMRHGLRVVTASSASEALDILKHESFPVVITDFRMPEKTGGELLTEIKALYPDTLGFILSGYADLTSVISALNSGAVYKFLEKPWNEQNLIDEVNEAFQYWEEKMLATEPPSSSLLNKPIYSERIASHIDKCGDITVIYFNIRLFRYINENIGYSQSDKLLHHICSLFSSQLPADAHLSRMNGAEYILSIPTRLNDDEVKTAIQTYLHPFSKPICFDGREIMIIFSAGYAFYDAGDNAEQVIRKARIAEQHSKERGLYQYCGYTPSMENSHHDVVSLQSELFHALSKKEFQVYYQPKICTVTGSIIGAEALIRWFHQDKGMVTPNSFIPLAEITGLIQSIGDWVLLEASEQGRIWKQMGMNDLVISVNISGRQLIEDNIVERIEEIILATGLPANCLELEITETFLMQDIRRSIGILERIRSLGVRIAIDDFGTGYSSLNYLTQLPVDTLKVDRSFISELTHGTEKQSLVKNVIALSHDLGMRVVAEGVETREQLDHLINMKCDEIQGFFFSPPVSADEFLSLLQNQSISQKGAVAND